MFIRKHPPQCDTRGDAIELDVRRGEHYILGVCVCLSMSSFRCVPAFYAKGVPNTICVNCVETELLSCMFSCFDFVIDEKVAGVS